MKQSYHAKLHNPSVSMPLTSTGCRRFVLVGPASNYPRQFHEGGADNPCIITWKARGNMLVARRYVGTNLHALDWNAGIRVSGNPSVHHYLITPERKPSWV